MTVQWQVYQSLAWPQTNNISKSSNITCIIDGISHLIAADGTSMIKVIALEDSLQRQLVSMYIKLLIITVYRIEWGPVQTCHCLILFHKCLNSCRLSLPVPSIYRIRIKKTLHLISDSVTAVYNPNVREDEREYHFQKLNTKDTSMRAIMLLQFSRLKPSVCMSLSVNAIRSFKTEYN